MVKDDLSKTNPNYCLQVNCDQNDARYSELPCKGTIYRVFTRVRFLVASKRKYFQAQ